MVLLDNQTRWNSQYLSISQALKLKERIIVFQALNSHKLSKDLLTESDWQHLQDLKDALFQFIDITNKIQGHATQGHYGSLWEWLPAIEGLYSYLESEIQRFKEEDDLDNPLAKSCQNGWEKLKEYYIETDKAYHLYAAAVLFCPEQNMAYFERNWQAFEKNKKLMLGRVRKEWTQYYKNQLPPPTTTTSPERKPSAFDRMLGRQPHTERGDPFNAYVQQGQIRGYNDTNHILKWWDEEGHPALIPMAFDLLSIPATSCDLERVFSSAKQLIQSRMSNISDNTIEIRECLRRWLKKGHIELQLL